MTDKDFVRLQIKRLQYERERILRHEPSEIREDLLKWIDKRIEVHRKELEREYATAN